MRGATEHSPQARWVRLAPLSDRLDGKQEALGFQQDWGLTAGRDRTGV